MNTLNFEKYGVNVPEILLPENIDLSSWSVIACDQFTQDYDYWKNAEKAAGGKVSTLNLILPEVYLNDKSDKGLADQKARKEKIRETMDKYISEGVFNPAEKEFIYIERTTEYGRTRKGLVAAIDLETYEWKPGNTALIRATEQTVPSRIPPRMEIRRGAKIESPHIMLLCNDKTDALVGGTGEFAKKEGSPVYDGKLMLNSGSIKGWAVKSEAALEKVYAALENLAAASKEKDGSTFLFAVGDGNHSLATAKAVWDEHKEKLLKEGATEEQLKNHPVRFALVEIVNIYDQALTFEPIHRVVFNADSEKLVAYFQKKLGGDLKTVSDAKVLEKEVASTVNEEGARFGFICENGKKCLLLQTKITDLAISRLQPELDAFVKENNSEKEEIEIDYIHGAGDVAALSEKNNTFGLLLPPIAKESFFNTIGNLGCLPRKSFSMGEASEKRFYVECRRLF